MAISERSSETEILDGPGMSERELCASLDFMGLVNRFFGGARTILRFLEEARPPERFSVLDIGSGGGDIAAAVADWAGATGRSVSVTALDTNPYCLRYASRRNTRSGIRYLEHSAFDIEALGSFDYVMSSMFFHHLSDAQIVALLGAMARQGRRGFIVNDLLRSPAAHLGATALSALSLDKTVFHDARLSVLRAFVPADFERYRRLAGLCDARVERRPIFRLALFRA
jgi:ubiquinone/menaquinone biosynthesis C-methylase UbiE